MFFILSVKRFGVKSKRQEGRREKNKRGSHESYYEVHWYVLSE